ESDKDPGAVAVDTSAYDPLLGMSANQFGALARTNHKCQGARQLGVPPGDGRAVYLLVDSQPKVAGHEADILAGVDTSLSGLARFAPGDASLAAALRNVESAAKQAQDAFSTHAAGRMRMELRAGLASLVKTMDLLKAGRLDDTTKSELVGRLQRKRQDF